MNSGIPPHAWVPVDEQIGWYGKLPGAGDFLYRRMPRELQAWWDRWMQNGLGSFKRWPDAMTRHYAVAPVWNFAIPATHGVDAVQFGCIAPSCDRVGRYYPVCVTLQVDARNYRPSVLEGSAAWYWQCGNALLQAIRHGVAPDQFDAQVLAAGRAGFHTASGGSDDILSILGPAAGRRQRPATPGLAGASTVLRPVRQHQLLVDQPGRRVCVTHRGPWGRAQHTAVFKVVFAGACAMGMKIHERHRPTAGGEA
jgi:type VI secretion system protein ImpM